MLHGDISSSNDTVGVAVVHYKMSRLEQRPHEAAYSFYKKWITNPEGTKKMVEAITRPTAGTEECPIPGIPNPKSTAHA